MNKDIDYYKKVNGWIDSDILMRVIIGTKIGSRSYWLENKKHGRISHGNLKIIIRKNFFVIVIITPAKKIKCNEIIEVFEENHIGYNCSKSPHGTELIDTVKLPYGKLDIIIKLLQFA